MLIRTVVTHHEGKTPRDEKGELLVREDGC